MSGSAARTMERLAAAVSRSARVAAVEISADALDRAGALYTSHLGTAPALILADENTWSAGGTRLTRALEGAGIGVRRHILPGHPRVKPMRELGDELAALLKPGERFVALGSGVLNDLTKYAAFTRDTPYMCVATAASMDGYTSSGAPLTDKGFKKTIECRPPRVVVADTGILTSAPPEMAGWGFGDLAGKVPAGGDWMIADALGIEPLDDVAWPMVQDDLANWLANAAAVGAGQPEATAELFAGLALTGFAMEFHGTSRPASGADHLVAHIWEMEDLHHMGTRVSHGACVAVGCMISLRFFDWLHRQDLLNLDVDALVADAPDQDAIEREIAMRFPEPEIAARAVQETHGKLLGPEGLRQRLARIAEVWPSLSARLQAHLSTASEMEKQLRAAGAPVRADEIGIDGPRLRRTLEAARFIRSRYTVLDLLAETGLTASAFDAILGPRTT